EALAALANEPVDLLLADWALGVVPTREVADAARRRGARTLVLLSPFERRDAGSAQAIGFDGYLIKPVRTRSLLERIRPDAPLAAPAPPGPGERRPNLPLRAADRAPLRVLLAEDDEVNALLGLRSLEKLGALVTWARDGREAFAHARDAIEGRTPAFDLILMDLRMPELDGAEATRRIRELEMKLGREERCRIVALSASLVGSAARLRETAGFDGFLTKPYTIEAVSAELGELKPDLAQAS
ncbi:MAG: response regulator, partial [Methylobacteriaceae bacterium]|nr:response regulator [Methylobacteriaceae bacterium]